MFCSSIFTFKFFLKDCLDLGEIAIKLLKEFLLVFILLLLFLKDLILLGFLIGGLKLSFFAVILDFFEV